MSKRRILLLTTIYPSPDFKIANNTNVVHYFVREWVKMGYDVRVVFNYPIYMRALHWVARLCKNLLASKFNTSVTAHYTNKDLEFEMDGVNVVRMPLYKPLPHGAVPQKQIDKQVEKIHDYCMKEDFVPDVIVAHNFYPHIPMVNALHDKYFKDSRTAIVIHKQRLQMLDYISNREEQIEKIDLWGYRSMPLKQEFENAVGERNHHFMCYSGIPSSFLHQEVARNFDKPLSKFVYVGSFIRRKHADKVVDALHEQSMPFTLDFVGDGANRHKVEKLVESYGLTENVTFHGFVDRAAVPNFVKKAECFVMISEEETFGLVYLEAMSMGCLTIASRGEGMDGIIIDGENGFLCKAGDAYELAATIRRINALSTEKKNRISANARKTALRLTDTAVAKMYAESLFSKLTSHGTSKLC